MTNAYEAHTQSVAEDVALNLTIEIAKAEGKYDMANKRFKADRTYILSLFTEVLSTMKPPISRLR
ncbi:hypothetical protein [Brucella anthropi]|uniref:hypothetical protein n=1 Tax=Brucella anthropi TaxID=529 RepID=UPI00236161D7|nr:hypothetical protein [Brucella anthropi]